MAVKRPQDVHPTSYIFGNGKYRSILKTARDALQALSRRRDARLKAPWKP